MSLTDSKFYAPAFYAGTALCIVSCLAIALSFLLSTAQSIQIAVRFGGIGLLLVGFFFLGFGLLIRAANKGPIKSDPSYKPWDNFG
ncbi:hypothetical protein [Pseudoxanthomonas japonensis]|uniref:hypothetical protein n=1 Tax=Pseudoxanthomonas japonensis TaxID=69284 RepID=UPI0037498AA5